MRQYDWLLFDADNTLFDFHRCEGEALKGALQDIGIEFEDSFHETYSEINTRCWEAFEAKQISKEELRNKRIRLFLAAINSKSDPTSFAHNYLNHLSGAAYLLDGALELLQILQPYYRLALVTNGLKEVQRPRIKAGQINSFFETVVVSDEIGFSKPHAPFFDYTFSMIGQPEKERVLIIGDNINADVKGGLDFGIHACWYNPKGAPKPTAIFPTYEIQHLNELSTLFLESQP